MCSLPRSNPGNRHQYKRVNGPFKLVMVAGREKGEARAGGFTDEGPPPPYPPPVVLVLGAWENGP